jgi:translation initiation factor eIF-2B subunit epsilon
MKSENQSKDIYDPSKVRKAVIIADTFTNLLHPLNENISEILMPVCSIPILEYMIDFLNSNSIIEIIICAKKNARQLDSYLKKYHRKNKNIKLVVSDSNEEFADVGDCLRKINAEKMISSDFLLIRGLVIANIDIEGIFNYHQMKKKEDPFCIITSILKNYKNDIDVKTKYDENLLIYDKKTKRILQYESTYEMRKTAMNENIKFTVKNLTGTKNQNDVASANYFKIRSDLYETYMDICSPEVLNIFSENFDYQSIRDHIFKNVIVSDVHCDTFYLYELSTDDYVGVIRNVNSYFKINNEILNRWAHPIVLENLLISPKLEINLKSLNMNIYFDSDVKYSPKADLVSSISLGTGCFVDDYSELTNVSAGKFCKIGKRVKIKNSLISNEVTIEDDVEIENSIISDKCIISQGAQIKNCFLGEEVKIPNDAEETSMRIYNSKEIQSDEETSYDHENNSTYSTTQIEKIEEETFLKNLDDKDLMLIAVSAQLKEDNEEEDEDEDELSEADEDIEEEEDYEEEIKKVIESGIARENRPEDIIQEISSLKNAFWEKTSAESKICL